MSNTTIKQLAKIVGVTDSVLLERLKAAGVNKSSSDDVISDAEKNKLLAHIQSGGQSPKKVSLKKPASTLQYAGQTSKVNVEVRKKKISLKKEAPVVELNKELKTPEKVEIPSNIPIDIDKNEVIEEDTVEVQPEPIEKPEEILNADKAVEDINVSEEKEEEFALPSNIPASAKKDDKKTQEVEENKSEKKHEHKKSHHKKQSEDDTEDDDIKKLEEVKKVKRAKGKKKRSLKEIQLIDDADLDEDELQEKRAAKVLEKKQLNRKINTDKIKVQKFVQPSAPILRVIDLPEELSVSDLALKMAIKSTELIKSLMKIGVMATQNQNLDQETATLVLEEMGYEYRLTKADAIEDEIIVDRTDKDTVSRAPVVTIMGHVDHGKTSLLDYIRKANVTSGEAGGITQHIGAYSVTTEHGDITFLDTPGHEAFTAMRSRGASCTDIVILVVAADDGVMPQTIEAIEHTKAAGVPMIVAVNKIDKEESDPDRVKNELSQHDVIPEDWGGDVIFTHVSAKSGEGIDTLLDSILLQSEVLELQAVVDGNATGVVVEAKLEKGRGPVSTVLIQSGTLNKGDMVIAGLEFGRVRNITNDKGQVVKSAGPSSPVEIIGLSGVPSAGDEFTVVSNEKKAKEVASFRQDKMRHDKLSKQQTAMLSNLFDSMGDSGEQQTLTLIIRADVQGSVEAICDSLLKLSGEHVKVNILSSGIGAITSSDITLASASQAIVFGFNVRADSTAKKLAEQEGVEIRYYSIIYDLIDDVKQAMEGLLSPEIREKIIGIADVRDVFRSSRLGAIAGCMVIEGVIKKNNPIRVLRDQVVIYEGKLESLRRFKEDVLEVKKDTECGIGVKNYNDVKPGDQIEVFETYEVKREI
ncbi:translation initiation factor IF-2 [Francisellaceae bacterium]|nr:translation initiation factor IF-2 [Francisellaceae bacterium]